MDDKSELYKRIWRESLFETLSRLRSIRFGLGYRYDTGEVITKGNLIIEFQDGPLKFKSEKDPIPLSELENALLCWSAYGPTGLIMADLGTSCDLATFLYFAGHTVPDPDNVLGLNLIYINDEGTFLYLPPQATKPYEINGPEDIDKIVSWYRDFSFKLSDSRTEISGTLPYAMAFNKNLNMKGSTVLLPCYDSSRVIVNILFHIFEFERVAIFDENTGDLADSSGKMKKMVEKGYLNPALGITMDMIDKAITGVAGVVVGASVQNIRLMATAMGLGPWIMGGIVDYFMMGALKPEFEGLSIAGAITCPPPRKSKRIWPYKVGFKKGKKVFCIIEDCEESPYKNAEDLVKDFLNIKYGRYKYENGIEYEGVWSPNRDPKTVPWKDEVYNVIRSHPSIGVKEEIKELVISFINYCVEKYGAFPRIDPFWIPMAVVVHHVDLDFYEKYYKSEMITEKVKNHFKLWH